MAKLARVFTLRFNKDAFEIGGKSADVRAGIRVMSHRDSTPCAFHVAKADLQCAWVGGRRSLPIAVHSRLFPADV